jgi:phasin family protein
MATAKKSPSATAEAFVADAQKSINEGMEKMTKGFEGAAAFGQDNIEAFIKSSEIAAKAAEGIGSEISAFTKKSFEEGIAAAQDFASAKTVTELFEKQTAFAQAAFDAFVKQSSKMTEIMTSAAKDITAPLSDRAAAATETVKGYTA